jgi:hypothetical protein
MFMMFGNINGDRIKSKGNYSGHGLWKALEEKTRNFYQK